MIGIAVQAAIIMDTLKNNVLGLSSVRRPAEIKPIIFPYPAANVRRTLPIAKSSTKNLVNP
jgi:hypothetical protein